ncbi:hypothetical protein DFQ30_002333, partial [Apophysomyces sp. BC1015]
HHLIGAAELEKMKPSATLVNIARGGVIDDAALADALRDKRIAAAGLDVFDGEPRRDRGNAARDGDAGGGQSDCGARLRPARRGSADTDQS